MTTPSYVTPPPHEKGKNFSDDLILNNPIILSIVVPIYNVAAYLATCLDSVLVQMSPAIELILVDDGSSDECPQIIQDYQQHYNFIQVITHTQNRSLGAARNSGVKHAKGEWLYFLDSDDFIGSNTLQPILEALKRDKPDMLVFAVSPYDNQTNKIINNKSFRILPKNGADYIIYRDFQTKLFNCPFKHLLTVGNYPFTGNKVFRRWVVESYPFPEKMYYEDLPFYIHSLLNINSQARLKSSSNELHAFYRINRPNSITAWDNFDIRKDFDIINALDQCSTMIKQSMPKLNAYFLVIRIWTVYFHLRDTRQNRWIYGKKLLRSIYAHFKLLSLVQQLSFPLLFAYHFIYKLINFSGNFRHLLRLFSKRKASNYAI